MKLSEFRKSAHSRLGFTLVEMLVVISQSLAYGWAFATSRSSSARSSQADAVQQQPQANGFGMHNYENRHSRASRLIAWVPAT